MNEDNKNFLSVKNLVVEYTSGGNIIHAVNHVSFTLEKGKTLGLVGETGAGKTSIAKAVLRVLPNPPARIPQGEILLEGENIMEMPEKDLLKIRGNKIAMIFQDPMTALNPVMTIGGQITEGILLHNEITRTEAKRRAIEMLNMVGITEERYDEYPFQFSGGMKQRVVIAMALACNPTLLLADEPTTALDVTIQAQVLDMISDLKRRLGTSMILITHDLGVVAEMCDDVAIVYAGDIVEYGSKKEIFKNPKHPYTLGLFHSLPSLAEEETRLHPIEGLPPDPSDLPEGCAFFPRCACATDKCRKERPFRVDLSSDHYCKCFMMQEEE
ncbi:MAG: ABC transporter ATP-binding protein [Lachnospiraceae bacterium]|nr:ABC transporter ATP-binding protein [Lachnospiraceae bacterium]MDE6185849.1 ABC transporter ATP-binding protein [Lachnospiraceae bacterium]